MSDKTGIEWTDATWNPIVGCAHVSPGCDNCYAAREAAGRLSGHPVYAGLAVRPAAGGPAKFTGEVRTVPERLDQPLRWKRPRRVFVNSMSDLFHPDVPDEFIAQVFAVMACAPQHTFQVLTKRPKRMAALLGARSSLLSLRGDGPTHFLPLVVRHMVRRGVEADAWPLPNVWLGVSIESDRYTSRRADHLRATPAVVRWISAEPLLGPLPSLDLTGIDWVVVGGESGPGARPMHPDWVRDLRDRCRERPGVCEIPDVPRPHSVPVPGGGRACECSYTDPVAFLFKQWGEYGPADRITNQGAERDGRTVKEWIDYGTGDTHARFGKKAAGRLLDGRTWDEYPEVRS